MASKNKKSRDQMYLYNCDGNGPHEGTETREMPINDAIYLVLCRACWDRELEWRKQRDSPMPTPEWKDAKVWRVAS